MNHSEQLIGQPVRSLQTMLRVLAEEDTRLPVLNPDGIFGQQTQQAVKTFQQTHQLPCDGVVNTTTWDAIADAYDKCYVNLIEQPSLCPNLAPKQTIAPMEENCHICLLQSLMHVLAQRYSNLPDVEISGCYDTKTQEAVTAFQKLCGHTECKAEIDRGFFRELFCCYRCITGCGHKE